MLTILSFILTILGCINWLLVGLLQYDFVAGIFGYQSSILSRIVYIIIGIASLFLVFKLIKGKGTIAVFSRRNKKDLAKNIQKMGKKDDEEEHESAYAMQKLNVEAGREQYNDEYDSDSFDDRNEQRPRGLFNEHFDDRDFWLNAFILCCLS